MAQKMTDEQLAQKEAAQNIQTEKYIRHQAQFFRMHWMIIPADVIMTRHYLIRYCFAVAARFALLLFGFILIPDIFIAAIQTGGLSALADRHYFEHYFASISELFHPATPVFLLVLVYITFFTAYLSYYAVPWNRRAKRLQSNPPTTPAPIPGVWPPPPRIVG